MTRDPALPNTGRRAAAVVALAVSFAAVVVVVAVALGRPGVLVTSLVCVVVTVFAAWYAVSRRGLRRVVGVLIALAALATLIGVLVASESIRVVVLVVALLVATTVAARLALHRHADPVPHVVVNDRPRQPVLIMNLKSGGGKAERFDLVGQCEQRGIRPIVLTPGSDLLTLARDAIEAGADVIGMAGGDGSQALVASVASQYGVPLVVIPAGTRNHFARDLGLDRADVVGALDAYSDAAEITIDLAEVNGRVFVNNASMGVYAKVVQSAEYRDAKLRTTAAMLPDLLGPQATPMDLRFAAPAGPQSTAVLVLVSNNNYQLTQLRGIGSRARIDRAELGIVALQVSGAVDFQRLVALESVGKVQQFSGWHQWSAPDFEVTSSQPIEIGVDGEALVMDPPLRFVIRPAALRVRLPRAAAERLGATPPAAKVSIVELWRTAVGAAGA